MVGPSGALRDGEVKKIMNFPQMTGPQFLVLYAFVATVCGIVALGLRSYVLGLERGDQLSSLDQYDFASLNGGSEHAFLTALTALKERKLIAIDSGTRVATPLVQAIPGGLHELEKIILQQVVGAKHCNVAEVFHSLRSKFDKPHENLVAAGLMADEQQRRAATVYPAIVMFLPVIAMALPRICAAQGRPVEFLLCLTGITISCSLGFLRNANCRTWRGDSILQSKQLTYSLVRSTAAASPAAVTITQLTLVFALFGSVSLDDTFSHAKLALHGPQSSDGSGCSGGSCGGGGCGSGCGG